MATSGRARSERSPSAKSSRGGTRSSPNVAGKSGSSGPKGRGVCAITMARPGSGPLRGRLGTARLLHFEEHGPPAGEHLVEALTRGGAHGEAAERARRLHGRNELFAKQIHLGEDDAVWARLELRGVGTHLVPELVVF